MGLEGLVSKHLDRAYRGGPCRHWLKVKNPNAPAMKRAAEVWIGPDDRAPAVDHIRRDAGSPSTPTCGQISTGTNCRVDCNLGLVGLAIRVGQFDHGRRQRQSTTAATIVTATDDAGPLLAVRPWGRNLASIKVGGKANGTDTH
jgi:hypothetical protein